MASLGPGHYVVLVIHVGGTKPLDLKLVFQREPRSGKTWFPAGSILPNEEPIDAAVRELHEETDLVLTPDDLTLLSGEPVLVTLPQGRKLVYVYSSTIHVMFATNNLRTPAQVEHAVLAQSTVNLADGTYVVPETINIDGLNITPAQTGLLRAEKHKSELLHFGYVAQWEYFRRAVYQHAPVLQDDTSSPRQFHMYSRFTTVDSGHVWLLIRGHINRLTGEGPTYLRVGTPMPTHNLAGLHVTLTETQRKAAINSPLQSARVANELEDWLEAQPQRFLMLGITGDSYDSIIWVTSQFVGHLNGWWLNRKTQPPIPFTYDELVTELRKSMFLPNIKDDAINALLRFTQSNTMSYAFYTKQYNDYLRRSREHLTSDVQCVRFINGLANTTLKNQAKSHRAQKGYQITLVDLQNFLNDVVTDSPELGKIKSTAGPSAQPTRKRNFEDPLEEASNI
jgi:8-oxo-dGTP pyrophosphatase MutT (NUDIX family)